MHDVGLLNNYLIVGALIFSIGLIGFLTRRNLIVMFLSAELMLQGVTLTLTAFSTYHGTWGGQVLTLFSLALAGGEASIAMALIVVLYRQKESLDISLLQDLREPDQPPIEDEFTTEEAPVAEDHWPVLTQSGLLPGQDPHAPRPRTNHDAIEEQRRAASEVPHV